MSPETVEEVRSTVIVISELIAWSLIAYVSVRWNVDTIRDDLVHHRWRVAVDRMGVADFTNRQTVTVHAFAKTAISKECVRSDRARFAYDLLRGRDITRRWYTLTFVAMGAALGGSAFTVAVRLLPMTDPVQVLLPISAAGLGILLAMGVAYLLTAGMRLLLKDRMAIAAEAVAEMLEIDDMQGLSRGERLRARAKMLHRVKRAFKKARIPASGIRCRRLEYGSKEEWERTEEAVVNRLARAYSGDYAGTVVAPPRRQFRDATETVKYFAGLLVSIVAAIAVWVS